MANSSSEFRTQWSQPSDVFSLLLILGGDVIQLALSSPLTPVAFSFGWVAYAVSAMLASVAGSSGPSVPEIPLLAFNLESRRSLTNQSWLLARVVRYYEFWMPNEVKGILDPKPVTYKKDLNDLEGIVVPERKALCVAMYKWRTGGGYKPGIPKHDWVWWSGIVVTVVQLGISAVPFGLHNDWSIFLITACGTTLAYAFSLLPQLNYLRRWNRPVRGKNIALTQGNGFRHVIIILKGEDSVDLERLADGFYSDTGLIVGYKAVLGILWILLLATSVGIRTNTWYLLAVGFLGMAQNLVVARAPRHPDALGIPLEFVPGIIAEEKVMWTLMELELKYPNFGSALLMEFFPGLLLQWEERWWRSEDLGERRAWLDDNKRKRSRRVQEPRG
ncbi:hypothetical protein AOQ84DRAFT_336700 [Glonium stellatum]|uniref:Uncharacterized protein n=1 Tax=Glonium stellatum TaxID=574774 RepID=A0A8E2F5P5_9PEZI|nr:hypothetical protein AOQ84DRAFT_336700 [Glonium stellatum]